MIENLKSTLEKTKITPISWLIGISGICMVRFFLEALSSPSSTGSVTSDAPTLIHYYLFFIGVALSTLIFLHFALPTWRKILPQFVSLAFIMILIAPIIDFVVSRGDGLIMTYLFQSPRELLHSFITFFGPSWYYGITIGIRIELALIILLTSFLIYKERKNIFQTIGFALGLYAIVFAFGALPSLISLGQSDVINFLGSSIATSATFTNNLHSSLVYSSPNRALEVGFNFPMAKILFLICIVLAGVYFYLTYKEKFIAVLKNSRVTRVLAYFSVIFFGMLLAHFVSPPLSFNWIDYLSGVVLLLAFYFSWIFAVCTNDIADEEIDAISNTDRPLIQNTLSHADLKQVAGMSIAASLIAGFLSGYYAFFCVLTFTALYYIYSMPPTQFKKIPFFASFLIGLCKLSCAIAGFFIFSQTKLLSAFPTTAIFGIPILFTLFVGLRDLKDIEGDRAAGINTPAVMFGPKFIGVTVALAYLLAPLFFGIYYIYIISVPAALLSYYFCIRKPYKELPLFLISFAFYLCIIAGAFLLI